MVGGISSSGMPFMPGTGIGGGGGTNPFAVTWLVARIETTG
jgi:hypothetical protein